MKKAKIICCAAMVRALEAVDISIFDKQAYLTIGGDINYCPFCGKKIKIER